MRQNENGVYLHTELSLDLQKPFHFEPVVEFQTHFSLFNENDVQTLCCRPHMSLRSFHVATIMEIIPKLKQDCIPHIKSYLKLKDWLIEDEDYDVMVPTTNLPFLNQDLFAAHVFFRPTEVYVKALKQRNETFFWSEYFEEALVDYIFGVLKVYQSIFLGDLNDWVGCRLDGIHGHVRI